MDTRVVEMWLRNWPGVRENVEAWCSRRKAELEVQGVIVDTTMRDEALHNVTILIGVVDYERAQIEQLTAALEYCVKQCAASGHIDTEPHMVQARAAIKRVRGD